ncbi:MAG: lasso RiPP family leader peptide-containing protein [Egibacteraceae bacterium]
MTDKTVELAVYDPPALVDLGEVREVTLGAAATTPPT